MTNPNKPPRKPRKQCEAIRMDGDRCPIEQLVYMTKPDEPHPGRYLCDVHRQARFAPERLVKEPTE